MLNKTAAVSSTSNVTSRSQHQHHMEIIEVLTEISDLLHCGLNKREIEILYQLADKGGLNAEALASIIIGLREECLRFQELDDIKNEDAIEHT